MTWNGKVISFGKKDSLRSPNYRFFPDEDIDMVTKPIGCYLFASLLRKHQATFSPSSPNLLV